MKNKFEFYEVVYIKSGLSEHRNINSKEGVVVGMAESEDGEWVYGIDVDDDGWSIEEKYLVSTGRYASRSQFYSACDEDKLKVLVDKDGDGELKDK